MITTELTAHLVPCGLSCYHEWFVFPVLNDIRSHNWIGTIRRFENGTFGWMDRTGRHAFASREMAAMARIENSAAQKLKQRRGRRYGKGRKYATAS